MYVHVLVPADWTVKRGHDVTDQLQADLGTVLPGVIVFPHVEPLDDPASYDHSALHPPVPPLDPRQR